MFPDITRDEVFRLETRRLWLRWPTAGDCDALAALIAQKNDETRQGVAIVADGAMLQSIDRWRAAMVSGEALHLAVTMKDANRTVIGLVRIVMGRTGEPEIEYCLSRALRGRGLMGEAVRAILDAAFMLAQIDHVLAQPRALNAKGRQVLERCGFTFVGAGLGTSGSSARLAACDVFSLDRRTWRSLKSWAVPDFGCVPCDVLCPDEEPHRLDL